MARKTPNNTCRVGGLSLRAGTGGMSAVSRMLERAGGGDGFRASSQPAPGHISLASHHNHATRSRRESDSLAENNENDNHDNGNKQLGLGKIVAIVTTPKRSSNMFSYCASINSSGGVDRSSPCRVARPPSWTRSSRPLLPAVSEKKEREEERERWQWRGLSNTMNSCYLNAALQLLATCEAFVDQLGVAIRQMDQRADREKKEEKEEGAGRQREWHRASQLLRETHAVLHHLAGQPCDEERRTGSNQLTSTDLSHYRKLVKAEWDQFNNWSQQDSHEILQLLMIRMKEEVEGTWTPKAAEEKEKKEKDDVLPVTPVLARKASPMKDNDFSLESDGDEKKEEKEPAQEVDKSLVEKEGREESGKDMPLAEREKEMMYTTSNASYTPPPSKTPPKEVKTEVKKEEDAMEAEKGIDIVNPFDMFSFTQRTTIGCKQHVNTIKDEQLLELNLHVKETTEELGQSIQSMTLACRQPSELEGYKCSKCPSDSHPSGVVSAVVLRPVPKYLILTTLRLNSLGQKTEREVDIDQVLFIESLVPTTCVKKEKVTVVLDDTIASQGCGSSTAARRPLAADSTAINSPQATTTKKRRVDEPGKENTREAEKCVGGDGNVDATMTEESEVAVNGKRAGAGGEGMASLIGGTGSGWDGDEEHTRNNKTTEGHTTDQVVVLSSIDEEDEREPMAARWAGWPTRERKRGKRQLHDVSDDYYLPEVVRRVIEKQRKAREKEEREQRMRKESMRENHNNDALPSVDTPTEKLRAEAVNDKKWKLHEVKNEQEQEMNSGEKKEREKEAAKKIAEDAKKEEKNKDELAREKRRQEIFQSSVALPLSVNGLPVYTLRPAPVHWRNYWCNLLGIGYEGVSESDVSPYQLFTKSSKPGRVRKVDRDGNCFFRAVSVSVFGTEKHHMMLRKRLCVFIKKYHYRFEGLLKKEQTIEQHLESMTNDAVWGTECEVAAVASMFGCDVFVYTQNGWLRTRPLFTYARALSDHVTELSLFTSFGIYLTNPYNVHFDVVRSIENPLQPSPNQPFYKLRSVLSHLGGARGGHYRSQVLVRDEKSGDESWLMCDDSTITVTTAEEIVKKEAGRCHVLLYELQEGTESVA